MTAGTVPAEQLRDAAARWGTPLYVTDLDAVAAALADTEPPSPAP